MTDELTPEQKLLLAAIYGTTHEDVEQVDEPHVVVIASLGVMDTPELDVKAIGVVGPYPSWVEAEKVCEHHRARMNDVLIFAVPCEPAWYPDPNRDEGMGEGRG